MSRTIRKNGNPGVESGDHVYYRHPSLGVTHGRVVCHGADGCTLDHSGGGRHKVLWSGVMGHRSRAPMTARVLDHGEDGSLVEINGRRAFIRQPAAGFGGADGVQDQGGEAPRSDEMTKAQKAPRVFFWKAMPPGAPKAGKEEAPEGGDDDGQAETGGQKFGPHNVSQGARVKFKMGALAGEGDVVGHGEHGATVRDDEGREHRVGWHEVTHGGDGDADDAGGPPDGDDDDKGAGEQGDGKVERQPMAKSIPPGARILLRV